MITTTTLVATSNTIDLDELEVLACAATRGPWKRSDRPGGPFWHISSEYTLGGKQCLGGRQAIGSIHATSKRDAPEYAAMFKANADFIAAANPAAILALVAQVRAAAHTLEYRTCCDHPDCTTCAGRGGFYRLPAMATEQEGSA